MATYDGTVRLLMHEIGHAMGLGHGTDAAQIMEAHSDLENLPTQWGAGDLAGLAKLGLQQGCVQAQHARDGAVAPMPDGRRLRPLTRPRLTSAAGDMRRSASGLPPVWQVGQYCRLESAKLTSRTVSPQTGHFSPVRPCTAMWLFFSPLSSLAASPPSASTASPSDGPDRVVQRLELGVVEAVGRLERRHPRGVQELVGVGVADAGDGALVAQHALDLRPTGLAAGSRRAPRR